MKHQIKVNASNKKLLKLDLNFYNIEDSIKEMIKQWSFKKKNNLEHIFKGQMNLLILEVKYNMNYQNLLI